jgi:hypothetical protein
MSARPLVTEMSEKSGNDGDINPQLSSRRVVDNLPLSENPPSLVISSVVNMDEWEQSTLCRSGSQRIGLEIARVEVQGTPEQKEATEGLVTLELTHRDMTDCNIVGNKLFSLIDNESQHSKWEEFRNLAKKDVNEECSTLLQRMELEDSDEEPADQDDEIGVSLSEARILPKASDDEILAEERLMKNQKRKPRWGPIERTCRF